MSDQKPITVSVVLERVKYPHNLAAAIRAAACFNAQAVLWTGGRFFFSDGERLPREERMKGYQHVVVAETQAPMNWLGQKARDISAVPVCGPEDGGVSGGLRTMCHHFVKIPAKHCLNLAAAVNVVLCHRHMQMVERGIEEPYDVAEAEARGLIDVPGWDGK